MPKLIEGSRTDRDPHYRKVNLSAAKRIRFCQMAAWKFLLQRYPAVAIRIRDEAEKKFPHEQDGLRKRVDISFLDGPKEENEQGE